MVSAIIGYVILGAMLLFFFGAGCGIASLLDKTTNPILIAFGSVAAKGLILAPVMIVLISTLVIAGILTPQILTADSNGYILIGLMSLIAIVAILVEETAFNHFSPLSNAQIIGGIVSLII